MKTTKISLRQDLARAILDRLGIESFDMSKYTDDDLIIHALIILLTDGGSIGK